MEARYKKWVEFRWVYYLDEPYKENEIKELLQKETVRKNLVSFIWLLQEIENNT